MLPPFYAPNGRRAVREEVLHHIAERANCTAVYGFSEMVEAGGAAFAQGRISGFMERSDFREWQLPLSAAKGMSWKTAALPGALLGRVAFALPVGFGNGSPLPQPSGHWDIFVNDRFAVSVRRVNHSQLWRNDSCAFAFAANRIETAAPFESLCLSTLIRNESAAAFGPALLVVPSDWVQSGAPAVIRVEARAAAPSTRWLQIEHAPSIFTNSDIYRAVDLLAGKPPRSGEYNVYFGDIHTHSGQVLDECANKGCGWGAREENYAFAEGPGGLDFYALTDHEWQMDPQKTGEYLALADAHNREGRFVCLPGFEHTNLLYGHRNIYFRGAGGDVVCCSRPWGRPTLDPEKCLPPAQLWAALEARSVPFLSVPHHPSAASHPCTFEHFSPAHDRLVEVYSCWGSSEYYGDFPRGVSDRLRVMNVRDGLRRGCRFGLIGSSDGHDGHPGDAQSPLVKHHHLFHFCGSGRAAVLSHELTRSAVFDALHARRCYATTGAPIILDVALDGAVMGAEIARPAGKYPRLRVRCVGSNGLDHVRIVKNGCVVHTQPCHGEWECDYEWEDAAWLPGAPAGYYVRVVQKDRESAWSSPIWIG